MTWFNRIRFSKEQARDDHGRFASGGTDSPNSSRQSSGHSLEVKYDHFRGHYEWKHTDAGGKTVASGTSPTQAGAYRDAGVKPA